MNKVKVTVLNPHTLELIEDAKKGSIIDLTEIAKVDTTILSELIAKKKDEVYEAKLKEFEHQLNRDKENAIKIAINEERVKFVELENKFNNQQELFKINQEKQEQALTNKYNNEIISLKNQLENLKASNEKDKQLAINNEKSLNVEKILNLQSKLDVFTEKANSDKILLESKYKEQINELTSEHNKLVNEYTATIDSLKREKSSGNVKQIGENLEVWCDNEYQSNNLMTPENIIWYKDNEVVKGHKGDFIYKVYATEERKEDELLTSAILEMKSEDPASINKQTNKQHFAKLDRDRNNKNIEYAILVSELEWTDVLNDIPIRKVSEYEKMYVVRPSYFVTLLNIIGAFGLKYKEILLAEKADQIAFKETTDILEDFEAMKNEIINNSIRFIEQNVNDIQRQSELISSANNKIQDSIKVILESHLITVKNKINNFNIRNISRRIDKVE